MALQASKTAEPSVEVVVDPPCVGPGGKSELPNSKLIFFTGSPISLDAIFTMAVDVPGPLSLTALCSSKLPFAYSRASAFALPLEAPKIPPAMP